MIGPGDKLKKFMQKFKQPKNPGELIGISNRKTNIENNPPEPQRVLTIEEEKGAASKKIGDKKRAKKKKKLEEKEKKEAYNKKIKEAQAGLDPAETTTTPLPPAPEKPNKVNTRAIPKHGNF